MYVFFYSLSAFPQIRKEEEVFEQILTIRVGIYYEYLYSSTLRESHDDHNSRTSRKRNTNDLLKPQGLQSYNTNLS